MLADWNKGRRSESAPCILRRFGYNPNMDEQGMNPPEPVTGLRPLDHNGFFTNTFHRNSQNQIICQHVKKIRGVYEVPVLLFVLATLLVAFSLCGAIARLSLIEGDHLAVHNKHVDNKVFCTKIIIVGTLALCAQILGFVLLLCGTVEIIRLYNEVRPCCSCSTESQSDGCLRTANKCLEAIVP